MSIKVKVRFFAMLRERLDKDRLEMELPEGATLEDLYEHLQREHPQVMELRDHLLVARGLEFIGANSPLLEGDQLSLYPPLSGG